MRTRSARSWAMFAVGVLMCSGAARIGAQVQYATGQNVAPTFEGWEHNPDGSYSLVFGYLNRNYEEEVDIPIGPGNSFTLKGETFGDKGQPTHFYPRRQQFMFKAQVAFGSLLLVEEIGELVMKENRGASPRTGRTNRRSRLTGPLNGLLRCERSSP